MAQEQQTERRNLEMRKLAMHDAPEELTEEDTQRVVGGLNINLADESFVWKRDSSTVQSQ